MDVSFGTIWEAVADRIPDACAVSEPGHDHTYAEFEDRAARLANALADAGVGPGDTVACYLYNGAAYLETVFAAFKIGAVPVNANYRYTEGELTGLLADADAKAVVFSGELAANVHHAAAHVPTLRLLVRVGAGAGPDAVSLEDVLAGTDPRPRSPRPGSDQLFMYTGGTTGTPKGVIWRQADLLHSMGVAVFRRLGVDGLPATLDEAVELAVSARAEGRSPTTLPVVPLMHATGLFNTMGALLAGGRAVTTRPGGLNARHVWETVAAQRVDTLLVAGNAVCQPLVDELVRAEDDGTPHDLSSLRSVVSSGTAFSDRLKHALHSRASVTITDAIASSEGGPFAFAITNSVDDLPARFYPVAATKVITPEDGIAAPGGTGVLGFSGPIPLGYHKDSDKTAATFRTIDGVRYSMPGDLVELEPDGAIRFLGRGSVVINTGGEKVYPAEVEHTLLTHPDVTDCVVIGTADETWGERVAAVVATRAPLTESALRDWVRRSLAGYKVPRTIVLVERLARTPTGKLELAWARRTVEGRT
ncbi:MAG TPA: AMP-binding protein [Pseudonocardiaceae bacterium]|nr:AMP-binding protein [Pseudonocardiaceae bacterium]